MGLKELYAALNPEQRKRFADVKDAEGLAAFASETGTELTEKLRAEALEYLRTKTVPLSCDELEDAVGGDGCGVTLSDGRTVTTLGSTCFRKISSWCAPTCNDMIDPKFRKPGKRDCYYLSYEVGVWYCNYNKKGYTL